MALIVVLAVLVTSSPTRADHAPAGHHPVDHAPADALPRAPEQVLVRWTEPLDVLERAAVLARLPSGDTPWPWPAGTAPDRVAITARVDALPLPGVGAGELARLARALTLDPFVEFAEVDRLIELGAPPSTRSYLAPLPDDPLFGLQWGLRNTGQRYESATSTVVGEPGVDVRALEAWSVSRGDPRVRVGVIDTAIDVGHPDLGDAVVEQRSTLDDRDAATKPGVHGTAVAGVIAARGRDGFGMTGLAPEVSIVSVVAFEELAARASTTTLGTILAAFEMAGTLDVDVINASWVTSDPSPLLLAAVADAGVPVVAASGNEGAVLTADTGRFPAGFTLPNLVSVTAIDPRGQVPAFANVGAEVIDVGAPGAFIATPGLGVGHVWAEGTSFAAPFVTAALALAVEVAPYATVEDMVDAVSWTSRPLPSLQRTTRSGGLLDAAALVRGVQRPVCRPDRLPAPAFVDVDDGGVHRDGIACVATTGVALGREDDTFAPDEWVTRAQLATFLARLLVLAGVDPDDPVLPVVPVDPEAPESPATVMIPSAVSDLSGRGGFVDVPPDSVHAPSIALLARLEIVVGDEDGLFHPDLAVNRGQMASVLVRTHLALTGLEQEPSRRWFVDTTLNVHADAADLARDLGIVRGVTRSEYRPGVPTLRGQMASFLARAMDALAREGVILG